MTAIVISPDESQTDATRFRAVADGREATGRTMGEALDALTADWPESDLLPSAILIQRFQPDSFFNAAQQQRMKTLLDRRYQLTPDERTELEALVDAELEATIARTDSFVGALRKL